MFLLTKILTSIILPPFLLVAMWLFSLVLIRLNYRKLGYSLSILGACCLYIISTPYFAIKLGETLVTPDNLTLQDYQKAQAIVVLGGGIRDAQEIFSDVVADRNSLDRVRYTSYLHQKTGLPILISGYLSEAKIMADELKMLSNIDTKWKEEKAKNTKENALYTKQILDKENINNIILVTNQWHMPRAKFLFEQQGFQVLPASTGFGITPESYFNIMYFMPQSGAMDSVMISLKEWMGYWKEKYAN